MSRIDPQLLFAWQSAHSMARSAPAPVHDRGGFRVDTRSEKESRRWVFPQVCDGLRVIARDVAAPRHFLKLCGSDEELRSCVPVCWELQAANHLMLAGLGHPKARTLPDGYRIEVHKERSVTRAAVIAPDGGVAASGCAAEAADVFIYDRIETAPEHRRKGLGAAVMVALGDARVSLAGPQLLVATEDGRRLYENLGWSVLAPLATAVIPER